MPNTTRPPRRLHLPPYANNHHSKMIYYTETMVETSSTSHFRTFLKPTSKYYTAKGAKGPSADGSGSMASRNPA